MSVGERFAASVVLALIAVCAFGATVWTIPSPRAAPVSAGPTPAAEMLAEPLAGAVVLTRDARHLVYTDADHCASATLKATESDTEVRLAYTVARGVGWCDRFALGHRPLPLGTSSEAGLQSTLAGRRVVDATTGLSVAVIAEADVPLLVARPPGWGAGAPEVISVVSDFGGGGSSTAADYFLATPRDGPLNAFADLWVIATTGAWHPPVGTPTKPVRVRGVAGRAAAGIVVWTVGRHTYALRWDPGPGMPLLDTATLVEVADSLLLGGAS